MKEQKKLLIAGVGGQGVVYLTNLLVEAALLADIPVATSEIHGLSQRGGSVMAGITFGDLFGFIEEGGADFLIGLEPLEAQRCLPYLNKKSSVIIGNNRVLPYSVNAQKTAYPDTDSFINYLKQTINEVVFISEIDEDIDPILRNVFILGRACSVAGFPVKSKYIEQVIEASVNTRYKEKTFDAFRAGRSYKEKLVDINR